MTAAAAEVIVACLLSPVVGVAFARFGYYPITATKAAVSTVDSVRLTDA